MRISSNPLICHSATSRASHFVSSNDLPKPKAMSQQKHRRDLNRFHSLRDTQRRYTTSLSLSLHLIWHRQKAFFLITSASNSPITSSYSSCAGLRRMLPLQVAHRDRVLLPSLQKIDKKRVVREWKRDFIVIMITTISITRVHTRAFSEYISTFPIFIYSSSSHSLFFWSTRMNLSHQFQFKSSKRFFNRENEIRGRAVTILIQYVHKRERETERERLAAIQKHRVSQWKQRSETSASSEKKK